MIKKAWEEIEIIVNANINELRNHNRYSDAKDLENCKDAVKIALMMSGYELKKGLED